MSVNVNPDAPVAPSTPPTHPPADKVAASRSRKLWWIVAAVVVVTLILIAVVGLSTRPEIATSKVERESIQSFIDERGKTRLPRIYEITMPETGRLLPMQCEAGDPVQRGDTLASMVPKDLELDVREAEATVARLQASLVEHEDLNLERHAHQQTQKIVSAMEKVVLTADAQSVASGKELEIVTSLLKRARQLVQQNAGALEDEERAELEFVQSSAEYEQDALHADTMRLMDAAMKLLPIMVEDYMKRRQLTAATVSKQAEEALVQLERARLRLQRGTMSSPIDGVVLERLVDNEQHLSAGTVLLRVGSLNALEIEAEVLTEDAMRIPEKAQVLIYGEGLQDEPNASLAGRVLRIEPQGFTKISSLGVEEQRVRVIIGLDESTSKRFATWQVGTDYRIRVRIVSDERADTLVIPRTSLFRSPDGQWQVLAVRKGRIVQVTVAVGLINDIQAEILDGLTAGESVVLAPENRWRTGMRVRATE